MSVCDGAQIEDNGILRLTNNSLRLKGHAFYSNQMQFKSSITGKAFSFSTAFAFAIVPEYPKLGGHGFAFTISPSKDLPGSLPSQYLGLLNASNIGNFSNHIFAVEFDTVQDFEFGDINDNHVGIDINSLVSNKSAPAAFFIDNSTKMNLTLQSGKVFQAWVDYDSTQNLIEVRLSSSSIKPRSPILSFEVDLSPFLHDYMYVGFSSSTGLLASTHYILGWSFTMNKMAQSLSLSFLPSLPRPGKNHTVLIAVVTFSAVVFIILVMGIAFYLVRKIKNADVIEEWEFDVGPHMKKKKKRRRRRKRRENGYFSFFN